MEEHDTSLHKASLKKRLPEPGGMGGDGVG